ncbi:HD domain-containing protein [Faecalispora anaeroviscerum]|uniref:HD domain-containing protein n=1 Tax=Faecalispora anaeroviscerum TaxID=2991836 RepID=UPI0024BB5294|nr:HD domain-containing protein [Faecalispora anaeroviscerum]
MKNSRNENQLPSPPQTGETRSLRVSLTPREREQFDRYARQLLEHPQVLRMEQFIQHGSVSCLEHSVAVAELSFWLCRRLGLHADWNSLVRGALLHDFFLYDWHQKDPNRPGLHGFTHPRAALKNAERLFPLSERERDIIAKHMWPLTLGSCPRFRESAIVCAADKCCSLWETFFCRSTKKP